MQLIGLIKLFDFQRFDAFVKKLQRESERQKNGEINGEIEREREAEPPGPVRSPLGDLHI